jgi:hypothetical protein
MKKFIGIIFLVTLLLSGCTKEQGDPYSIRFYGDAFEDIGYSVAIASDGYIIGGQLEEVVRNNDVIVDGSANKNMAVIKTDWSGTLIWKTTLGGAKDDYCSKIYQLSDGSIICAGTFTDTTHNNFGKEVFVTKLSSSGEIQWQKTFGGEGNQKGKDIVKTSYGFMLLGTTDAERLPLGDSTGNIKGNLDFLISKINDNGDHIESFAVGYPGNDDPAVIRIESGDNCIVFGTTDRSWPGQGGKNFMMMQVFSTSTTPGPTKILGTSLNEYGTDMEIMNDGGYLLVGTAGDQGSEQSGLVIRTKKNFFEAPLYSKNFKVEDMSTAINAISPYGSDNFVLAGYSGVSSASKMLVFEMDPDGNLPAGKNLIKGSSGEQLCNDVVSGDDGYIIAVGKNKYDINSMISFLKFKF